jgi:hypothetical protein
MKQRHRRNFGMPRLFLNPQSAELVPDADAFQTHNRKVKRLRVEEDAADGAPIDCAPHELVCPVSRQLMLHPVMTFCCLRNLHADACRYAASCPLCCKPMSHDDYAADPRLKRRVSHFLKRRALQEDQGAPPPPPEPEVLKLPSDHRGDAAIRLVRPPPNPERT